MGRETGNKRQKKTVVFMMQFVRDFGRLLIAMLLINVLLIWLLSVTGTWSRWANNASDRRDTLRGGTVGNADDAINGAAALSESLPNVAASADDDSLIAVIQADPELTISTQLIESTISVAPLPQPMTIFLPTDAAWERMPPSSVEALLNNPEATASLLRHHAAAGILPGERVAQMKSLPRMTGGSLPIRAEGGLMVGNGGVVSADIPFDGGILHKLDHVQLPNKDVSIDTPDGATELDYTGSFITINGSGRPNLYVILRDGNNDFGTVLVDPEGRWSLSGDLAAGRHALIAYLVQSADMLPLAASTPIILNSK